MLHIQETEAEQVSNLKGAFVRLHIAHRGGKAPKMLTREKWGGEYQQHKPNRYGYIKFFDLMSDLVAKQPLKDIFMGNLWATI